MFPNGSVLLAYRAGGDGVALGGGIGIAFAEHWSAGYARIAGHDSMLFAAEDAYLFQDHNSNYHMLVHAFRNLSVGGHAWSRDGLKWTYAPDDEPAYSSTMRWTNGSSTTIYRRERPQPLVIDGQIQALLTGAWPCHLTDDPNTDVPDGAASGFSCASFTAVTPIVPP